VCYIEKHDHNTVNNQMFNDSKVLNQYENYIFNTGGPRGMLRL